MLLRGAPAYLGCYSVESGGDETATWVLGSQVAMGVVSQWGPIRCKAEFYSPMGLDAWEHCQGAVGKAGQV